jgi:hypothetical protein
VANYELSLRLVNTKLERRREMGSSKCFWRFECGDELPLHGLLYARKGDVGCTTCRSPAPLMPPSTNFEWWRCIGHRIKKNGRQGSDGKGHG